MKPLTVDVEDYWSIASRDLLGREIPVSADFDREMKHLLDTLDALRVSATCFVVGRVAQERPHIIREIVSRGHEIASHSFEHLLMDFHTPRSFEEDLKRSIVVIEDVAGVKVHGFRAPAFSLRSRHLWAFDIMAKSGIRYDSSVRIVWPWGRAEGEILIDAARSSGIHEYPGAAIGWKRLRAPLGGGGGLRHFPAALNRWGVSRARRTGYSVPIYIHPYDLSTGRSEARWPAAGWARRIRFSWFDWTQRRGRSRVAGQVADLVTRHQAEELASAPPFCIHRSSDSD